MMIIESLVCVTRDCEDNLLRVVVFEWKTGVIIVSSSKHFFSIILVSSHTLGLTSLISLAAK